MYAAEIPSGQIHGSWTSTSDATSANGLKLTTPDAGWSTASAPLVAPADYIDVMFDADAGIPYTLWLRMRALNDNKYNDALWVQFSDALVANTPVYPLNSTSGLLVNLATDATAVSLHGWGWQNGAYWLLQPATVTFAASGSHTMRIQVREDGVQLDQIVLSPGKFLTAPPGPLTNDSTILPRSASRQRRITQSGECSRRCEHDSHFLDVERKGRDQIRCAIWQQQPAAAGSDGDERGVIRSATADGRHDLLLAHRRAQQHWFDHRAAVVVQDRLRHSDARRRRGDLCERYLGGSAARA
jgi:hypothetical protein